MKSSFIEPLENIVKNGFCVGCGSCSYVLGVPMSLNMYGEFNPDLSDFTYNSIHSDLDITKSCPFLDPDFNEDVLAKPLFEADCEFDSRIGYQYSSYVGFVKESNYRSNGTSGGMGTWLGAELMRMGEIDAVIHVKPNIDRSDGDVYFKYAISNSLDELCLGSKTRYHVVEISEVMALVRDNPGQYLFIGLPCICKSVRRLQLIDKVLKSRIKFIASLVCGHLKSLHWTLSLAWGSGIKPTDLKSFQYRTKGEGIPARSYVFKAVSKNEHQIIQKNSAEIVGGKFNSGALMLNACDYCDDVVGETADITIGDAWIAKYEVDSYGTNLIIVRNVKLDNILNQAKNEDRLALISITADEAAESQSGGFRQRREGLSYRLEKNNSNWVPVKRIKAGSINVSLNRQKIYDRRMHVAKLSREIFLKALHKNDYNYYFRIMDSEFKKLRSIELRNSFFKSISNRLKRLVYSVISSKV